MGLGRLGRLMMSSYWSGYGVVEKKRRVENGWNNLEEVVVRKWR